MVGSVSQMEHHRAATGHDLTEPWTIQRYTVGAVELGVFFAVKGEGASWVEAFKDADWAEARDQESYLQARAKVRA